MYHCTLTLRGSPARWKEAAQAEVLTLDLHFEWLKTAALRPPYHVLLQRGQSMQLAGVWQ